MKYVFLHFCYAQSLFRDNYLFEIFLNYMNTRAHSKISNGYECGVSTLKWPEIQKEIYVLDLEFTRTDRFSDHHHL